MTTFCVEHWRANYNPPKFQNNSGAENTIEEEHNKCTERKENRYLARYIEKAAKNFENYNFVIRPHPVARPNWWVDRFWKYRNVHINGIKNVAMVTCFRRTIINGMHHRTTIIDNSQVIDMIKISIRVYQLDMQDLHQTTT